MKAAAEAAEAAGKQRAALAPRALQLVAEARPSPYHLSQFRLKV